MYIEIFTVTVLIANEPKRSMAENAASMFKRQRTIALAVMSRYCLMMAFSKTLCQAKLRYYVF